MCSPRLLSTVSVFFIAVLVTIFVVNIVALHILKTSTLFHLSRTQQHFDLATEICSLGELWDDYGYVGDIILCSYMCFMRSQMLIQL